MLKDKYLIIDIIKQRFERLLHSDGFVQVERPVLRKWLHKHEGAIHSVSLLKIQQERI